MNRRRNQPKTSPAVVFAVILAAVIVASGGVLYVLYKNRQIEITREIDSVEKNAEHCRLEMRTMEMRMDQLLNRFVIRKKLEEHGSELRPISVAVIEEVPLDPQRDGSVASTSP